MALSPVGAAPVSGCQVPDWLGVLWNSVMQVLQQTSHADHPKECNSHVLQELTAAHVNAHEIVKLTRKPFLCVIHSIFISRYLSSLYEYTSRKAIAL
jgi:hypothetical protein